MRGAADAEGTSAREHAPHPALRATLSRWERGGESVAGALIGLAVISEYPCAVAAIVLIAFAWRRAHRIIIGALPFAILLAVYNRIAFGTFFAISSGNEADPHFRELASRGVFGIGAPSFDTLLHLLVDPGKGLLLFSPVLVFALLAIPRARRAMDGAAFGALIAVPLALVLLYSGYPNWHGGWTVGVRYLVPAMPFLAMLLVFAELGAGELVLLGASIAAVTLTSLVFPFVPPEFPLPWDSFAIPVLLRGLVAPNLLHFVARPLAIVVPFALVVAAIVVATRRHAALLLIGIVATIAAGFFVHPLPIVPLERDYFVEVVFGRTGTLPRDGRIPPGLLRRADVERRLPPTPWPF